jgi:hypothetical protein
MSARTETTASSARPCLPRGGAGTRGNLVSGPILAAELVVAQHAPGGGAVHLVLLGGVVVTALVLFGVNRWWTRRESAKVEEQSTPNDRSAEGPPSPEEE